MQTELSPAITSACARVVATHGRTPGGLLEALHALQADLGYVPDAAHPILAEAFAVSRADVLGIVTFYHDFRRSPRAAVSVRVCQGEACLAVGGRDVAAAAEAALGCRMGHPTNDQRASLAAVYCLGNCALGPTLEVNGELEGQMVPERVAARLHAVADDGGAQ